MGVLGLTPFLQKTCPEVIKHLPDRLKGFAGKRIVFDGTLITQRFHFAQVPHPYRHVLGWYRMIKELEACGVEAVCVFDGKERTAAKASETLRRKETQRLTIAREAIERERLKRLNQLSGVVSHLANLTPTEKARLSDALGRKPSTLSTSADEDALSGAPLRLPEDTDTTYSDLPLDPFWRIYGVDYPSDQDVSRYMDSWSKVFPEVLDDHLAVSDVEVTLREESFSVVYSAFGEESGSSEPSYQPSTEESPSEQLSSGEELGSSEPSSYQSSAEDSPSVVRSAFEEESESFQPSSYRPAVEEPGSSESSSPQPSAEESPSIVHSMFGEELGPSQTSSYQASAEEPPSEQPSSDHEGGSVPEVSAMQEDRGTSAAPDPTPAPEDIPPYLPPRYSGTARMPATISDSELFSIIANAHSIPVEASTRGSEETTLFLDIEHITTTLAPLYFEYQSSVPKIASIPLPPKTTSASETIDSTADDVAAKVEYEMSKKQYQLTLEEGKFWDALTSALDASPVAVGSDKDEDEVPPVSIPTSTAVDAEERQGVEKVEEVVGPISHEEMLHLLTQKSAIISESYARRTVPPSTQTYNESKEVLRVLGVPVVEPSGPFEAEALASSLVLNGYADYVASEDTDVLIYEAPLIRNITTRHQPLIVVSGADIRSMLQLTRDMFIDFALLLGTDFSQRIKNVGPARALKFIREYGSIEKVIEAETKYPPRLPLQDYLKQVDAGRSVYRNLPPVPEEDGVLKQDKADEAQVLYVMGKYGLSREVEWNWESALEGNYFDDNPSGI